MSYIACLLARHRASVAELRGLLAVRQTVAGRAYLRRELAERERLALNCAMLLIGRHAGVCA